MWQDLLSQVSLKKPMRLIYKEAKLCFVTLGHFLGDCIHFDSRNLLLAKEIAWTLACPFICFIHSLCLILHVRLTKRTLVLQIGMKMIKIDTWVLKK